MAIYGIPIFLEKEKTKPAPLKESEANIFEIRVDLHAVAALGVYADRYPDVHQKYIESFQLTKTEACRTCV